MAAGLSGTTLLQISLLLLSSFILGEVFERIGLESIIGYIISGLILGPSVLNIVQAPNIRGFATIGATLILFEAGLRENNVLNIFKDRQGVLQGVGSYAASIIALFGGLLLLGPKIFPSGGVAQYAFLALSFAMVDIGVPSKLMLERGLMGKNVGKYSVKSSVINVTTGFVALTLAVIFLSSSSERLLTVLGIGAFVTVFYILHEFIHKLDDYIVMFEETEAQFAISFSLLLLMSFLAKEVGISSVLGAFFAGIVVSRSQFRDSKAFQQKISAIGEGLFIPLFFAWFGVSLSITEIIANFEAAFVLFAVSTLAKLGFGYLVSVRHDISRPLISSASLLSLDIETLVALIVGQQLGIISEAALGVDILQVFAPSVLLTTTTITLIFAASDRLSDEGSEDSP